MERRVRCLDLWNCFSTLHTYSRFYFAGSPYSIICTQMYISASSPQYPYLTIFRYAAMRCIRCTLITPAPEAAKGVLLSVIDQSQRNELTHSNTVTLTAV